MPPKEKKYQITVTIAFTLDVTAKNESEAIEEAQYCCVNDGEPDTLNIECHLIEE
jgi:hypothetical protein